MTGRDGWCRLGTLVLLLLAAAGCELAEVTLADPEQVMVAEVYLRVDAQDVSAVGLVYRTPGPDESELRGGAIRIVDEHGGVAELESGIDAEECVEGRFPSAVRGAVCFAFQDEAREFLVPGGTYTVEVELPGGGRLDGSTTLPGSFSMVRPRPRSIPCNMPSGAALPMEWTRSSGAWSYVPEADISGLPEAMAPLGISVPSDPVTLLGLSVSEADTTIAFPGEFGVFNRFSGDRELLVALQAGFPTGQAAILGRVVVPALDRNATNWLRGGPFNPSGTVRIPSLFGDGTGVVGGVVVEDFDFRVDASAFPSCLEV